MWTALSQSDESNREGLLVFVEPRPKPTRDGVAASAGASRFLRTTNIYEQYTFDIFTMRPDGTGRRQITTDGMNRSPKWSRDGEWIAYINGPEKLRNLMVVRADGSDRKTLLERELDVVAYWWSLDSRKLLVAVESRRGNNLLEGRVVDIESGDTTRLANSDWMRGWNHWEPGRDDVVNPRQRLLDALPGVTYPFWSPDSQFLAFVSKVEQEESPTPTRRQQAPPTNARGLLALVHVETVSRSGRFTLFNTEPPVDSIYGWSWSRNELLFQLAGHPYVARLKEGQWGDMFRVTTRIVQDARLNTNATRVAFTSVPGGKSNTEIFVVDVDGDNETQLTNSTVNHLDLDWQPVPVDSAPTDTNEAP
jgi:Tol biopolymer transport system component